MEPAISQATALISELCWAANNVQALNNTQRRRLFREAAAMLEEMRGTIEASGEVVVVGSPTRIVVDLTGIAHSVDHVPNILIARWMCKAADALQQLRHLQERSGA